MKIRSITCFLDPANPLVSAKLKPAGNLVRIARPVFTEAGYELQSARLASLPFPKLFADSELKDLTRFAQKLEAAAKDEGFAYVSLGPALPERPDSYVYIPEALAGTQNVFFSGSMTTQDGEVSLKAVHQCASIIQQAGAISAEGFANLRFAALANVPAGSPFFPAAYHSGAEACFALATEAADLAVEACSAASSLQEARNGLVHSIEAHAQVLTDIAHELEQQSRLKFRGIDFSLAPFPAEQRSLGMAIEHLGVPVLGMHGSLAAAAILADAIDQANFPRIGFSGLFLPVLEDAILAQRVEQRELSLMELLLYSAVCGTGLDTIPLPGDTSSEQLAAVLLDLACLSTRLAKPLTARLMPIPGKKAGDLTGFEFAYFANSRVLPLHAGKLNHFLAGEERFPIRQRHQ
jgi:uncharacterized protein (UPF0210 family)